MSLFIHSIAGVLLSLFSLTPFLNDEPADTTLQFDEIVITASKIPLTERETTKPVLVIDRREIEQNPGLDISQLLDMQSGIRVNNAYGTPSGNKGLFLQGAGDAYTLILIDGLAVNDVSGVGGVFDLRMLPLHNIERIEVIKSSQSTLYGTDAVAGVINIITQKNVDTPFQASGSLAYGSFNTLESSLSLNGAVDGIGRYNVSFTSESSDGISAAAAPEGAESFENDGYNLNSVFARFDIDAISSLTISPFINVSLFEGDYDDGAFQDASNQFESEFYNPGVMIKYGLGDTEINAGYNYTRTLREFRSTDFNGDPQVFDFDGRLHNADIYATHNLSPDLTFLAGLNYQEFIVPATDTQDELDANITSPYLNLFLKDLSGFSSEFGYRLNSHSKYGTNHTFNIAPAYNVTDQVKLFASFGTGFKAPTLDQFFSEFGGNLDLEPQTSRYFSAGIENYLMDNSLKVTLQYYNRQIDNVIAYDFAEGFVNRDRQNDSGVELSANWLASTKLSLGGYYNFFTGELTTRDGDGNRVTDEDIPRRPTHSFGANIRYRVTPELRITVSGEYNSSRPDLFFNPETFATENVTLDAYSLVKINADYSFAAFPATLFISVNNLFDTDFTEVYGFNTTGFAVKGGVRFRF